MIICLKPHPAPLSRCPVIFADDDLVRQFINGWWVCSWAVFVIDALGRISGQLPAPYAAQWWQGSHAELFLYMQTPSSKTTPIRIFFPHPCPFPERKPVSMSMRILKHSSCRANSIYFP